MDYRAIERATYALLVAIGEDPTREGLLDTPARVAKAWVEFMTRSDASMGTAFATVVSDQMVVVSGMRVWSMCEHHLLPFWCDITVGYIPTTKLLGLSKFARIAHAYAGRLQLQEQLVSQIAGHVRGVTGTEDVAVIAQGEHLCMTMRGAKTPAVMTSSALSGKFKTDAACRSEFMALAMQRKETR
jgi:GTP cyclohydrolase I